MPEPGFLETESLIELPLYLKRPVNIVRGQGARLYDLNGKSYLDCICGHGVVNLGHCHPKVVRAIQEQAQKIITCSEIMPNETRAAYLLKLREFAPEYLNRVFLCNSGAESVEASIKFARLSTGRSQIIAAMRGFHGRTYGALSATHNPKYRDGFEPLVPDYLHIPFNDLGGLSSAVSQRTAAVLLEVVQGEGGVHPASTEFLMGARELCDRHGALLILDEIQSGFARTGKLFAFEHYQVKPDMLNLAKAIAGGVPMGALLCNDKIHVEAGKHGTTFGGNPLACAAAIATLDAIREECLIENAGKQGTLLLEQLKSISSPKILEVRGLGLMIGIELRESSAPYLERLLLEQDLLALPAGPNVIRLLPPLNINDHEREEIFHKLKAVLQD